MAGSACFLPFSFTSFYPLGIISISSGEDLKHVENTDPHFQQDGSGHRASANAIEKKLQDKGHETCRLDVFPLMGKMGLLMENSYIPLTTRAPFVYYLCQRVSEYFPWFIHGEMYFRMRKNLMKVIEDFKPNRILSVHCLFTQAISKLIRKEKLGIPFYVGVIDLIDPPKVWEDRDADMTFVPTERSGRTIWKEDSMRRRSRSPVFRSETTSSTAMCPR